jgi:predicted GTPase
VEFDRFTHKSQEAVQRADVAVVVFDASARLRAQDLHIVGIALVNFLVTRAVQRRSLR